MKKELLKSTGMFYLPSTNYVKLSYDSFFRKSENAPQSGNDTMIEHRIAGDDPGVFRVWDRRINGYIFDEQSSLYSLLRAWVQDDPDRPLYHEVGFMWASL